MTTNCKTYQSVCQSLLNGKIQPKHWQEFRNSAIAPAIVELNFQSLEGDEPYDYLVYSTNINRRNDGRLRDGDLMRYRHTQAGGWWCNGVDPLNNYEPMMWGCFKPNSPRSSSDGKLIKYEHPLKEPTRVFLLQVDENTWKAIAAKYGIELTAWDLLSNFWYWVWEKNLPITLTEGAKKAASLLSHGYVAIGLPGVNGAVRTPKNQYREKVGNSYLIPDVEHFATMGREITIAFDHDTKPKTVQDVRRAISSLGWLLRRRGCQVRVVGWGYSEKGVDDLIFNHGQDVLDEVCDRALPIEQWQVSDYSTLSCEPDLVINSRYLANIPAPEGEKLICVKSAKGTGKSHALIPIVREAQQQGIPVLLLTHRIQLGKALAHNLGLPFLSDLGQSEVGDLLGFGLCVDSLHPMSRAKFNADNWKNAIVLIDETEQVLWHTLNSNTEIKKHRSQVLQQLSTLLYNTLTSRDGKVFLLDADLTDVSINTVIDMSGMEGRIEPWLMLNQYQGEGTTWNINHFPEKTPATWLQALLSGISEGERPFVCLQGQKTKSKYSTKNLETLICKKFPQLKILRIDSESIADPNHPAFGCMEHLNELVPKYDVFLCSPCVETGISIDVRGHFTSVWGCFQGISPENSTRQSLARVREAIPRNIWVAPRGLGLIGNGAISLYNLMRSQQRQFKLNVQSLKESGLSLDSGDIQLNQSALSCWGKMACRINAGMADYREAILNGLRQEGHRVVLLLADESVDSEDLEAVREGNYQIEREEIVTADISALDEKTAKKLQDKKVKTKIELLQERKYNLAQRYGQEPTPELVEKDDKGYYSKLRMHYFLSVGREHLPEHDKQRAKASVDNKNFWLPDFNGSQLSKKIEALNKLGIHQFITTCDREIHNEDLEVAAIVNKAMGWRNDLKDLFGVNLNPERSNTQSLGQILKMLDLNLECTRKQGRRGQQERFYRLTGLEDGRQEIFKYWLTRETENQMTTEPSSKQMTTELSQNQVTTELGKQVTTGLSQNQMTTEPSSKQMTTELSQNQVTTELSQNQVTTELGKQVTTGLSQNQMTTELSQNQMTTEPSSKQMTTELSQNQVTTELGKQVTTGLSQNQMTTELSQNQVTTELGKQVTTGFNPSHSKDSSDLTLVGAYPSVSNNNIYTNLMTTDQMTTESRNEISQLEIVEANAENLASCENEEQIQALTESWEQEFKKQVWALLPQSDRDRIRQLKRGSAQPANNLPTEAEKKEASLLEIENAEEPVDAYMGEAASIKSDKGEVRFVGQIVKLDSRNGIATLGVDGKDKTAYFHEVFVNKKDG